MAVERTREGLCDAEEVTVGGGTGLSGNNSGFNLGKSSYLIVVLEANSTESGRRVRVIYI